MRALFTLFLVAKTDLKIQTWMDQFRGYYSLWMVYYVGLSSIFAWWMDFMIKYQKKTVMLGGILLCIGYTILAFDNELSFYLGCFFVILGVGGLKPNISKYGWGSIPKGDEKDLGFYIFYMGINIGGFVAPILCGWIERHNWHYGFGLAAIGMFFGQLTYFMGRDI